MAEKIDIAALMAELLEKHLDGKNFKFTERGKEIINEISDCAEKTEIFQKNKYRGEMLADYSPCQIFIYMLDRVCNAPTTIHRDMSVLLIMPFFREKFLMLENIEGSEKDAKE